MEPLSKREFDRALQVAEQLKGSCGDAQLVSRLALSLNERITHLEKLVREVEHYLDAGLDVSQHAHLLRDIRYYRERFIPRSASEKNSFGLE